MGAAVIAAAMRMREQRLIDAFRAAGATSPSTAKSFAAVGVGDQFAIRRLHNRAVIREAAPGSYYLDEEVWTAVRNTRRRLAAVLMSVLLIVLIGALFGIIK
jgi:hypothetical protein